MELLAIILVAAGTFGVCYLVDKGFTKVFRSKPQHMSGQSLRLSKKYATIGLILAVVGFSAVFAGISGSMLLLIGGVILIIMGIGLVLYYMTFGVYYDDESFLLTTFGKRSNTYYYRDIQAQQLYMSYGTVVIELHLSDGRSIQLQSGMEGVYPFLDKAYAAWVRQTGIREEDCTFHDPANSCWFPPAAEG